MHTKHLLIGLLCAASLSSAFAQTTIYSDSFSGDGTALNGATTTVGGGTWSANNFVNRNGTINGANEGSALLTFNPVANMTYTLTLDVSNTTDRWVGLGFARDPLTSPGASFTNDRLSNETEGISWMLYRDHASDQTQDIQLFGGLRTASQIADNNFSGFSFSNANTLKIVIDTTGDGSSFTANFFINDNSLLSSGPVTIARSLDDINYVGFTFDNATASAVSVDNFSLTAVPEPSSFAALAGLAGLGFAASRRRRA